ncbi:MAG: hypothetical protein NC093_05830 [Alistipes sp.]|nr:hypothetical protein [Alistipes sp.]
MKNKDAKEKTSPEKKAETTEDDDDKLHITKSVFQTSKERKEKEDEEERKRQEALEQQLAERRKKAQEAHDKRLEQERLELLKLKHGVIEESEAIHEETEEKVRLSLWGKIKNFFYHNKWWLGIGTVTAFIAVFLIVNLITRPNPDMIVLMIGENYTLNEESDLTDYITSFCEDFNENGKTEAAVYYIPYTGDQGKDYANGVQTKLTVEVQSGEAVIVIGNNMADEVFYDTDSLVDLETLFPGNDHVNGCKLMLSGTKFAEKVGVPPSVVGEEWFLAIRKPQKLMNTSQKKMQKVYDRDVEVFMALVEDICD